MIINNYQITNLAVEQSENSLLMLESIYWPSTKLQIIHWNVVIILHKTYSNVEKLTHLDR